MSDTPSLLPVAVDPRTPGNPQYRRPQVISHLTGLHKYCRFPGCDKPATHIKRRIHEVSPNSAEVSCVTFYYYCGSHNTKS